MTDMELIWRRNAL